MFRLILLNVLVITPNMFFNFFITLMIMEVLNVRKNYDQNYFDVFILDAIYDGLLKKIKLVR